MQQCDLKSTNDTIPQVVELPADLRESISPGPPVYFEITEKLTNLELSSEFKENPFSEAALNEENLLDESIIGVKGNIHNVRISHSNLKCNLLRQKENMIKFTEAINSNIGESIAGILGKKNSGILESWTEKYCRIYKERLLMYEDVQTGLLSGVIDFAIFPCSLTYNSDNLSFKYFKYII